MSKRFSIAQARAQLPAIIDRVAAGADIELTRRGEPVAVVVSTREYARLRAARVSFAEAFGRFTAAHPSGAGDCMVRGAQTIRAQVLASEALNLMEQKKITSVVVVDEDGKVLGVVHLHDLWTLELI